LGRERRKKTSMISQQQKGEGEKVYGEKVRVHEGKWPPLKKALSKGMRRKERGKSRGKREV